VTYSRNCNIIFSYRCLFFFSWRTCRDWHFVHLQFCTRWPLQISVESRLM